MKYQEEFTTFDDSVNTSSFDETRGYTIKSLKITVRLLNPVTRYGVATVVFVI